MTPLSFRSLLLAAIFLSNCITWTVSKHHYTHNVNGHRSRHRRQGAGLFLSASYVLPGGEGSGWGEWGEISACSRTCGGGVASQKRICLQVGANGQPQCSGGDTKYFSCQTQDCPAGSTDFRAQQCSEFDDQVFRDKIKYNWVPYTKGGQPCELNCMPRAERFYYRQREKVVDGTRCNDDSFDVCVNGTCQPVGCDMMLGSNAKEDKCRVCRGNNANCHTISGLLDTQDLRKGYNEILLIPEGATTIIISEVAPSNNYLALRAKNGTYYLNGDYHIDFPRSLVIAGAMWTYERSQQGFAAPDKLRTLGPTTEPLYLSILLQDPNVGIQFEYSLPKDMAPPQDKQYNWVQDKYTPCSATCGGGIQTSNVTCRSREELEVVEDTLCDAGLRPPSNRSCSEQACPPAWVPGAWGPCSKHCGKGGERSREVTCQTIISHGYLSKQVADSECFDLLGQKPKLHEKCNENASCPTWFTGPWKPCDKLCDQGKQTRQVVCHHRSGRKVEVLSEDQCEKERPPSEQGCMLQPCEGVDWVVSPWTGCDSCLSAPGPAGSTPAQTFRSRALVCATKSQEVVDDKYCYFHPTPSTKELCDPDDLPPCDTQWYASQWSDCSTKCGKGNRTRKVFCGVFDGASVTAVDDSRCAGQPKYNDTKPCEVPKDKCQSQYYVGPWTACDKNCMRYRKVMCLRGEDRAIDCPSDDANVPSPQEDCPSCNEDQLLPVIPTNAIPDDYDDCEDEELYPEAALDEDIDSLTTLLDTMFSDGIYTDTGSGWTSITYEPESNFTVDSSLSSDELLTSGTGSTETLYTDLTSESEEDGSGSSTLSTSDDSDATAISVEPSTTRPASKTTSKDQTTTRVTAPDYDEEEDDEDEPITTKAGLTTVTDTSETVTTETSESSETTIYGSTESGPTETTDDSVTELSTDETTVSETSDATATTESDVTEATETSAAEATGTTELSETSDASPTTESLITETTEEYTDTSDITTSDASETTESEINETTEASGTDLTTEGGSTTESTDGSTESEPTDATGSTETIETTEFTTLLGESTETGSTETDETGSTETAVTSTTEIEETGSTETTATGSTETGETGSTETSVTSTTEEGETGSTETTVSGSTEIGETGSTETTVTDSTETSDTGSTETSITDETGSTEATEYSSESSTTESEGFTSSAIDWMTTKSRRKCPPKLCVYSTFGCCPGTSVAAGGPFDEGCVDKPETCKRTKHGCCPDGVSPAKGPKGKGCPLPPCAETLYGCCDSDNKTSAEGNDQEGCPPPPPPCKSSKYGCCKDEQTEATGPGKKGCPETTVPATAPATTTTAAYEGCEKSSFGCCHDNATEAAGPNQQGCPCSATEFGCCLDGVTAAQGPGLEGCLENCNSTAYGCCPDGKSPAHGPNKEGCCLRSAFGCCPDNYNYARGPHLEGCGCEYSPYGCCPDNVTSATGYDNKGCGCSYTPNGCCPDGHTEASGPSFEGCPCHTYQFGCCPDGVTIARGPGGAGCHCSQSTYKCCGDGETAATGPNQQGCDCSTSKYGCCPDGQTAANGTKFKGCTDAPENKQAACALKFERGTCRNYSVYWYFDTEYGGCSRFWYGGCDGNGNKFATKEECDDTCVSPPPKDTCKLPASKGACLSYNLRWYYDAERETCTNFAYGGCLGNSNNFESREACQKQCEPEKSTEQCGMPIERGSCSGNYPRWGFNSETRACEQFVWGGCEGNTNRFSTEAACNLRCNPPGQPKPECSKPQDVGQCNKTEAVWSFSLSEDRCLPFYYTGCGGNENRFYSKEECEDRCPSAYVPDKCTLPYRTGSCANYREKWYFDTKDQRCRQFYYGGCDGNSNNFDTERQCQEQCQPLPATTTVRPTAPQPTQPTQPRPQTDRQDFCALPLEAGPCSRFSTAWGYDAASGRCTTFQYGGCGGNRNNFPDERYCQYYCKPDEDVCQLPMQSGPCDDSQMKWFYDRTTETCNQFTYGGCEGNGNRFDSRAECENQCKAAPRDEQTTVATTTTTVQQADPECQPPPSLEPCGANETVFYYDSGSSSCRAADIGGCRHANSYATEEECERRCGAFRGRDVCREQVNPGPCRAAFPKFYFDFATGSCQQFTYGGCQGGPNRFSTIEDCEDTCKEVGPAAACLQAVEVGEPCAGGGLPTRRWHYSSARADCLVFAYQGCGGTENNFASYEDCVDLCNVRRPDDEEQAALCNQYSEECERLEATCQSVTTSVAPEGCQRCACADCERERVECARIRCPYDVTRVIDNGCERCVCSDPCESARCGAHERCVASAYRDPATQDVVYTAHCVPESDSNEVSPDCEQEERHCASLSCPHGVSRRPTDRDCQRCECAPEPDCAAAQLACQQLNCTYGLQRAVGDDGCERCECQPGPCDGQQCAAGERCVASAYREAVSRDTRYLAECRLVEKPGACPTDRSQGTQGTQGTAGACRRACDDDADCRGDGKCCTAGCSRLCVSPAPADIHGPPRAPQASASAPPPVAVTLGGSATLRCVFHGNPPPKITWRFGEITITGDRDRYRLQSDGALEIERVYRNDSGVYICIGDNELGSAQQQITLTVDEVVPSAPEASAAEAPEVVARFGGLARLRCTFHGHRPPRITWRFGEITIDGDHDRYRLLSDGALEIASVYRNDSGVYVCIAENELGSAQQTIRLQVTDPVEGPTLIAGDPSAVLVGSLERPLEVRCRAYGHPAPAIYWYRGINGPMVPFSNALYEARDTVLTIKRLTADTLGEYACYAYNGLGKPATWVVIVKAYQPDDNAIGGRYFVPSRTVEVTPREPSTQRSTTPRPEVQTLSQYLVPVQTELQPASTTVPVGKELSLPCNVDGYPEPVVSWTKDGARLAASDRIWITGARLTIPRAVATDSGVYGCHASNRYSEHSSTVQISVQEIVIPLKCTDSPYFANCHLIVQGNFCHHKYYSKFCCKSCVEAGMLDPRDAEMQADQPFRKK